MPTDLIACSTCNPKFFYSILGVWFVHSLVESWLGKNKPLNAGSVLGLLFALFTMILILIRGYFSGRKNN